MEHILIHLISALVRWLTTSQKEEGEEQPYQGRPGPYPYTPPPPQPRVEPRLAPPVYEPNYRLPPEQSPMSDVDDYLRRVRSQQAAPPPVRQAAPPARVASMPIDVEILDEPPTGRGVAQHVSQHMSTRQFADRAEHIADDVERADDDMDQRLHQKFDHKLGRLAGQTAYRVLETQTDPHKAAEAAPEGPVLSAMDIATVFRTLGGFRQAFIVSEILKPAHERNDL